MIWALPDIELLCSFLLQGKSIAAFGKQNTGIISTESLQNYQSPLHKNLSK
jgi:hypothetical protein